jgi:hypothetical protein
MAARGRSRPMLMHLVVVVLSSTMILGCSMRMMAADNYGETVAGRRNPSARSRESMPSSESNSPPPQWHVQRNRHNQCSKHKPLIGAKDCMRNFWQPDNRITGWHYHGDGWLGERNDTYRSPEAGLDGGFQCTYDSDGRLVTSGMHRGTYDYIRPEVSMAGHRNRDVIPHETWPRYYEDPDLTHVYECADGDSRAKLYGRTMLSGKPAQSAVFALSSLLASPSPFLPLSSIRGSCLTDTIE